MSAAFRDMLHLAARPLEPAALTLRSRYQLPDDSLSEHLLFLSLTE